MAGETVSDGTKVDSDGENGLRLVSRAAEFSGTKSGFQHCWAKAATNASNQARFDHGHKPYTNRRAGVQPNTRRSQAPARRNPTNVVRMFRRGAERALARCVGEQGSAIVHRIAYGPADKQRPNTNKHRRLRQDVRPNTRCVGRALAADGASTLPAGAWKVIAQPLLAGKRGPGNG